MDAKETLKVYFGYDAYKPGQEEIIDAVLMGKDVLAKIGRASCRERV